MSGKQHESDDAARRLSEFMGLLVPQQRRLYQYIMTLLPRPSDAEDILQETIMVLWAQFEKFERGTSFHAWAAKTAYHRILKHRRRLAADAMYLSPDVMEQLAAEGSGSAQMDDAPRAALADCLGKLRPDDRQLIERRYTPGVTGKQIASELGRPANSVSKSLGRIRRALLECIQRALRATRLPGEAPLRGESQ